jgi:ribosomal protein S12 methylthiotransferase
MRGHFSVKHKISIISLGCARNLVDSELIIGKLKSKGFVIVEDADSSDIVIINTCAFIEDAKREAIDIILKAVTLKKEKRIRKLVVCGCLAQRYCEQLKKDIPEIDAILGVDDFKNISKAISSILRNEKFIAINPPGAIHSDKDPRLFLTPSHYAYVKVAEGCDNRCSYCAIYNIRGKLRSRPLSSIISEIKVFSSRMRRAEINIIAQDTTSYGMDRYGKFMLPKLLKKICRLKCAHWIRLLYTHPRHFTDELIDTIAEEHSICKYIDLPIQHISDKILSGMNRRINARQIESLIKKIRDRIPDVALRTSVIVGFPGETERDFNELLIFLRHTQFERLGAFIYSREEGTPAYNFKNQIATETKNKRLDKLMRLQQEVSKGVNKSFLGKTLEVLVEARSEKGIYTARTQYDAPEVDGTVFIHSKKSLRPGQFVDIEITDTLEYDLVGKN